MQGCNNRDTGKAKLNNEGDYGYAEVSPEQAEFMLNMNYIRRETRHHMKGLFRDVPVFIVERREDLLT